MADVPTTFASLSNDAPNVYIASRMYTLAERRLVLGKFATRHTLPQRTGKTFRVVRPRRLSLPNKPLTEGVPPDAVALVLDNVDVTVEQWGIVVLLTDVALITTKHPMLAVAIERTAMAMAELLEREMAQTLMSGTQVFFPGTVNTRATITGTDIVDSATILKATTALRDKGAPDFEGGLYGGAMPPQVESDILGSDQSFRDVESFANVRKFEYAEIGVWQAVRWTRGNFLPKFKGVPAPSAAAATNEKAQATDSGAGGTFGSAKIVVVARDPQSDYERKISQVYTTGAGADQTTITAPTSTAYVYDIYTDGDGGTGPYRRVASRVAASSATVVNQALYTAGELASPPAAPADQVEVFVSFIVGKDAFGRVELNGMSLQSFITPPGASWSNPLAQGRKVGNKIMWKSFVKDNEFFCRIESESNHSAGLAA